MNINEFRAKHLAVAEFIDAWRIIPRIILLVYSYLIYTTVIWYKGLAPYMLEGCASTTVTDCIVQAPTTQHAALVTAVIGIAAAIFGLYTSSGRKWNEGMQNWDGRIERRAPRPASDPQTRQMERVILVETKDKED